MSHSLETFTFATQYTRIVKPGGQTEIEANRILSMFAVYLLSQMCKIYCKHIATSAQKPIYYKIDETLSLSLHRDLSGKPLQNSMKNGLWFY